MLKEEVQGTRRRKFRNPVAKKLYEEKDGEFRQKVITKERRERKITVTNVHELLSDDDSHELIEREE